MGIYLSSPNTTKITYDGETEHVIYGSTEMQGWRKTMEDACITQQLENSFSGKTRYLFAVFDGHGGNQVSEFVRDNFINELNSNKNFIDENYEEALIETFDKMDKLNLNNLFGPSGDEKLKKYNKKEDSGSFGGYSDIAGSDIAFTCGCTACVVLIVGDKIFCANAGDSRSVLSRNGKSVALSFDHKPSNPDEEKRIK